MRFLSGVLLAASLISSAVAQPAIEIYGDLPSARSLAISPDGKKAGFITREGGLEGLLIYDFGASQIQTGVRTDKAKGATVSFASPNHAVLHISETTSMSGFRGRFEYSAAFSFNLEKEKIRQLLRNTDELFPAQSGLGRIVGRYEGKNQVFMPGFIGSRNSDPSYGLFRVDLDTGRGRVHKRGTTASIDWFVDTNGEILAHELFDDKRNIYAIEAWRDGKLQRIYEQKAKIAPISVMGIKPDQSGLVVSVRNAEDRLALAAMTLDGKISKALFERDGADVERVISNANRFVLGVQYSGLYSSYEFFDENLTRLVDQIVAMHPSASVRLTDWTDDFSKLVFYIAGSGVAPAYHVLDREKMQLLKIADAYEGIADKDVAEILTIEYKARDGLKIPAILTRPRNWREGEKYPAIIMPHGGPEAYDAVGFDFMAQFFASRGYLVLQPNFRGSDGFGNEFRKAGHGEWGRGAMQHDITDGLKALIGMQWVDPERVCIVGASYGGYAALAGGAFTPDLYSCVAAIAPVADLPRMLLDEKRDNGRKSWVLDYWKDLIGDPRAERDKLKSISPSEHAAAFQAPVLLIHGNDDLIVPYRQSTIMERALKKAGKDVTLVKLKGEDHHLSISETRLAALKALDAFVNEHIGQTAVAQSDAP